MINMKVQTGYIYHIKDEFFDKINDKGLMINHENGHARPTYFTIKDKDVLWFIPLSSKISKYQPIIDKKVKKYGSCRSILIETIGGREQAILIQNAFPTLEKYIDHPHIVDGKPLKVIDGLKNEILDNFRYLLSMKNRGNNLFFTDIDKIKKMMLKELEKENK